MANLMMEEDLNSDEKNERRVEDGIIKRHCSEFWDHYKRSLHPSLFFIAIVANTSKSATNT